MWLLNSMHFWLFSQRIVVYFILLSKLIIMEAVVCRAVTHSRIRTWFETKTSKFTIVPCTQRRWLSLKLLFCSLWNFVSVLSVGMPSIRPLETLHNSLSLRQLDAFLEYVTATIFKTPCPSPRLRSPLRSNPFVFLATCDNTAVL